MSGGDPQVTELILAARQAQAGALDRLLVLYTNYLKLVARASIDAALRAKADPSDVVQETLIKAHAAFEQFHGATEAELITWLRQILARNIADLARRYRSGSRRVSLEVPLEEAIRASDDALGGFVAGEESSPSQAFQRRETAVVVADALATLSADHREVIVLRSIEERDWLEIAEKMGRTPDAVRVLWARALRQLKPRIEERL